MLGPLQVMMSSTTAPFATDVWKVRRRVDDAYMVRRSNLFPLQAQGLVEENVMRKLLIVG